MFCFNFCFKLTLTASHLCLQVWEGVVSGEALEDPSLLSRFFTVTYAVSAGSHGNVSYLCKPKCYIWNDLSIVQHPVSMVTGCRSQDWPMRVLGASLLLCNLHCACACFTASSCLPLAYALPPSSARTSRSITSSTCLDFQHSTPQLQWLCPV